MDISLNTDETLILLEALHLMYMDRKVYFKNHSSIDIISLTAPGEIKSLYNKISPNYDNLT